MRADGNSSVARRRAMMEDARMNPRKARKLYEEEDEEIEIEADAVEFDEESEGDIESQTLNLIKAMQADGMLSNVTIEGEGDEAGDEAGEEEDFEDEELDESVKSRSRRIAEAKARIARRRVMESRRNRLANAKSNPNPNNRKVKDILNKRIAEARLNKKEAPVSGSTARRIAEAKARIARRRVMESRRLRNR